MDGVARGAHLELNVVQRCALRDLPVETGRACGGGDSSDIDDEVADGAVEVVGIVVPLRAVSTSNVRVNI